MKSIKEQAEELEIEVFRTTRSIDVAERCKWSYIKGARYVLEQIESLMKNVSDEYPRFQQGAIIQGRLIKLLEQLKK